MLGLALLTALAVQGTPEHTALPESFQPKVIETCAPATLDAAVACLRRSVSAEDLAILSDRIPARRFRTNLDCALVKAWHLADPAAPMAKVMDGLLGVHEPSMAAGMIISELQVRAGNGGKGLPFDQMRAAITASPPPPWDPAACARFQS